jgi:hypothetical protein
MLPQERECAIAAAALLEAVIAEQITHVYTSIEKNST